MGVVTLCKHRPPLALFPDAKELQRGSAVQNCIIAGGYIHKLYAISDFDCDSRELQGEIHANINYEWN